MHSFKWIKYVDYLMKKNITVIHTRYLLPPNRLVNRENV